MAVIDWAEQTLPKLTGWVRPLVPDVADAEDIATEAILRSWLAERRGQTVSPSYAFRSARTILLDWQRHQQVVERSFHILVRSVDLHGGDPAKTPDMSVLDRLTPRQRQAFQLRSDGLTMEETGEAMGTSVHAIKKLCERGRARARNS